MVRADDDMTEAVVVREESVGAGKVTLTLTELERFANSRYKS